MSTTDVRPDKASATRLRRSGTTGANWWREVSWRYLIALVMIVICVFPLLYAVSAALQPGSSLQSMSGLFSTISFDNFANLDERGFWNWLQNSLIVCTVTAIGTVLMGAAAAYAFSRFRFKGREKSLTGLLLAQMFPQTLAFVAIFLLLLAISDVFPMLGLDHLLGLICVYLGGALGVNTFLMYGFFNTVPIELDEAAKIDGATHAQIFWGIILRLVTPILAVVGLLSFISAFGDFLIAKVVLQHQENWTVAVGLYSLAADERTAPWGVFAAGAVVAAIPIVTLFLLLQKYIVGGLTAGSVKG